MKFCYLSVVWNSYRTLVVLYGVKDHELEEYTKHWDETSATRALLLWFLFPSFYDLQLLLLLFLKTKAFQPGARPRPFSLGFTSWVWKWRTRTQGWGGVGGGSCRAKTVQLAETGWKCLGTQKETPQGAPCPPQRLRGSWFWNSEKCSSAAGFWIKDVMQLTTKSFPLYDNFFTLFPLVFVRRIHLDSQKQWLFINIICLEATEKQTESDIVIWRR